MTLCDAFESYFDNRQDLRPGTKAVYKNAFKHASEELGDKDLTEIKYSNITNLYSKLRYDVGLKPRTIELLNSVLNPIFNTALRDQMISCNPVEGALHEVSRGDAWLKENKPALTIKQQKTFMEFVRNSRQFSHWETLFIFFLGTGCRVGETIGLRWDNVDFSAGVITIDHSMTYLNGKLVNGPPKTRAGYRKIPILSEVRDALEKERRIQYALYGEADGFVFKNGLGQPHLPATINQAIRNIVNAYNRQIENSLVGAMHVGDPDMAITEPLPQFSVHQLRHTFCTRLCEEETNLKVIQSVMGHSDIKTTMNIYASITEEKKAASFADIDGKIVIR